MSISESSQTTLKSEGRAALFIGSIPKALPDHCKWKPPSTESNLGGLFDDLGICWAEAIQKWNESLTVGPVQPADYHISLYRYTISISSNDVLSSALEAFESYSAQGRRGRATVYQDIVSCLKNTLPLMDGFMRCQPEISSILWGSVRALLQVAIDNENASELAAKGVLLIAQHAARWDKMARQLLQEASVKSAITGLYFHILAFLIPARHRFEGSRLGRIRAIITKGEKKTFMRKLDNLRDAADRLEKEACWESCQYSTAWTPENSGRSSCQEAQQHNLILDWLSGRANPICLSMTVMAGNRRPWLVDSPKFQLWMKGESPSTLWVCGKAGCGKSYLANALRDDLERRPPHPLAVVSHAFRANESARETRSVGIAVSVLDQLIKSALPDQLRGEVFQQLYRIHAQYRVNLDECPFHLLWGLCERILKVQKGFILIIDALDECEFGNAADVQSFIKILSSPISSAPCKIIIFTRPNALLQVGTSSTPRESEIVITPADTRLELNTYCRAASTQLELEEEEQHQLADRVTEAANGDFLWATLCFDKIKKAQTWDSLKKMVESTPSSYDEFLLTECRKQFSNIRSDQKQNCQNILHMLLAARRKLKISEVQDALDFLPRIVEFLVSTYCQRLVTVTDQHVHLSHATVRDLFLGKNARSKAHTIGFDETDPDSTTARLCLEYLSKEKYGRVEDIGWMLKKSIECPALVSTLPQAFYDYAAQYWSIHLTNVQSPTFELVKLAGDFLASLQFSYWAEYSYTDVGDFQAIRSALRRLVVWSKTLSSSLKNELRLSDYFKKPYLELNRVFKDEGADKELEWLALMRLGYYYFDIGNLGEMNVVRSRVARGLIDLLGPRNPLTLRARSEAAYATLFNGEADKALQLYSEVADDQRKESSESKNSDLFTTLMYQGQAEYLLNNYQGALYSLSTAMVGFIRIHGADSNGALSAQLWHAQVNAATGQFYLAREAMEQIRLKRQERYGPEDSFAITTQLFLGEIYRKSNCKTPSLAYFKHGYEYWSQFFDLPHFLVVDSAIQLVIAYRDFGMHNEAFALLEEVLKHLKSTDGPQFVRLCQAKHLNALLLYEEGEFDQPIQLLQALLIDTDRERNNRALLWARLDLAHMLRDRDEEGDDKLASSIFHGIVTDNSPGDEPDSPKLLFFAEKALRLVRAGNTVEARRLLENEGLEWVRQKDFWLMLGMPGADTTIIKAPGEAKSEADPTLGWITVRD